MEVMHLKGCTMNGDGIGIDPTKPSFQEYSYGMKYWVEKAGGKLNPYQSTETCPVS
jgi:hypothetical protein